jgi:hypothetical protein
LWQPREKNRKTLTDNPLNVVGYAAAKYNGGAGTAKPILLEVLA